MIYLSNPISPLKAIPICIAYCGAYMVGGKWNAHSSHAAGCGTAQGLAYISLAQRRWGRIESRGEAILTDEMLLSSSEVICIQAG